MNLLTIFLVYVLKIRSNGDLIEIQKVFFLENDFWCAKQKKLTTDQMYLYDVGIDLGRKNYYTSDYDFYLKTSFFSKSTNLGYIVLKKSVIEGITSFLESPEDDKCFMKFSFLFTDKPIETNPYNFESYKGRKHECITYTSLERTPENKNTINLRYDGIDIRMEHIKSRFSVIISKNLIIFNDNIKILSNMKKEPSKIEYGANFELYYFKNYSECLENLKKFVENLYNFNLLDDDNVSDSSSKMSPDETITLKVCEFEERFCYIFFENLEKLYEVEIDETWEKIFEECYYFLENMLVKNRIFLPIIGKYDIDYYINQLSNLIYELAKKGQKKYTVASPKDKSVISFKITSLLSINLKKLQIKVVKDLCECEYVPKYFSKLLGREVKTLDDYIVVEKIVCDYSNMFEYIFNLHYEVDMGSRVSYSDVSPIFFDKYKLKIIDGIKIKFLTKFRKITGFDNKGEEIIMVENSDFFINKSRILYCPSEALKMKNIHEIEVFDFVNNIKKFKITEYLTI